MYLDIHVVNYHLSTAGKRPFPGRGGNRHQTTQESRQGSGRVNGCLAELR
ncbi:MAG: hypothetical protein ABW096_20590 [Candidatus Thiodiazotropha sp.]